ncbi:MAG: AI-2E family transporter [Pirellulales bacterium]|nr:AI-2E family transporter [Pirellulales bacterium]
MAQSDTKPVVGRGLMVLAALVIVVAGMRAAAPLLVPFLLAVFIAVIIAPLFVAMRRRRVPTALALVLMIVLLVVLGLLGITVVRASLDGFSAKVPEYQERLQTETQGLWQWLDAKGIDVPEGALSEVFSPQVAMRYLGTVTSTLSGLLAEGFLILLVVVFIFLEAAILPAKIRALPGVSGETWGQLEQLVEHVQRYMSLKTLTCLLTGVLVGIMAAALGIDFPVLMGLLAFLLNFVPNIGSFIAAIPGVLLALVQYGPGTAGLAIGGYVVINVLVGNVLEPRIMGRGLGISPLVILISMIFWGWALGAVGMLLSVPLTIAAKVGLEGLPETRWIALLMSDRPGEAKAGP